MKTITQLLSFFLLMVIITLAITSCKKNNVSKSFSVEFKNGYGYDYGWVILHNLDGTEVSDYKKLEGDGIADFGEINEEFVTVTMISIDTINNTAGITSDYACPIGHLIFTGNNYKVQSQGVANITMTYPGDSYDEYVLAMPDDWEGSENVPYDMVNTQNNVHYLNEGNKYSIYGAVLKGNSGYCNWLLDQSFQLSQTNYYTMELNKPIAIVNFTTSRPLDYFFLYGCWNQRNSDLMLYRKYYWDNGTSGETNHDAYLPENMPLSDMMFSGSFSKDNNFNSYLKYYSNQQGLPYEIEIPEKIITAVYNESADEMIDIQVTGKADQIFGLWYGFENDHDISWLVYANWDQTSIKRPVLPDEIINDLGNDLNILKPFYTGLLDYNTTSSQTDIINRFFIENVPLNERYSEYYQSYYLFSQNKKVDARSHLKKRGGTEKPNE